MSGPASSLRRVVVTGGAGFIGSHIVDRLVEHAARVVVVDDLSSGSTDNLPPTVELESADVADARTRLVIRRFRPDAIVHAAANASVVRSSMEPALDARTNVLGTIEIARLATEFGAAVVYLSSGGAIYGEPRYLPCDEDHPVAPRSAYGLSKWVAEQYLHLLVAADPGVVTLRLANVYGPRQRSDLEGGVVSIFLDRLRRGQPLEIHGDGMQTRDFIHVDDVVTAVMLAMAHGADLLANIGTEVGTSIVDLAERLMEVAGRRTVVRYVTARPDDVRHNRLDPKRARMQLGWTPSITLHEGLTRLWSSADNGQAEGRPERPG